MTTSYHITQLHLYSLMLSDWLTHGLSNLCISSCIFQCSIGNTDAPGSDVDPTQFETTHGLQKTLSFLTPDQVIWRNPIVIEHQLCRINAFEAEFF